jgi:hypothetical protein
MTNVTLQNFVYPNRKSKRQIERLLHGTTPFPDDTKRGILLHGPWGTSKSTLAGLVVDSLRQPYLDQMITSGRKPMPPHKLDCRMQRTLTDILSLEATISVWPPAPLDTHHIIIEEVDRLDAHAAAAALSCIMDKKHAVFILTTNELSGVDKKTVGRCHVIDFHPENTDVYIDFLKHGLNVFGVQNVDTIPIPYLRKFCSSYSNNIRDINAAVSTIADDIDDLRAAGKIP